MAHFSRRGFMTLCGATLAAVRDRIVDVHQHTVYGKRDGEQLVVHQMAMGVTMTVLLPVGTRPGLAPGAGGNASVLDLSRRHPGEYVFFANARPGTPETRREIEKYLELGGIGIGEQKFPFECDSAAMQEIYSIAQDRQIPVLLHFKQDEFNRGLERFYRMAERYSRAKFIGHAESWWGNIDRNHDQAVMYPKGPVTPGGISDRLLADYPNIYADLSAHSGLNALLRDEDHARAFLHRHQNKLMFGSDCSDSSGSGPSCWGSQTITALRRLAPSGDALPKILHGNAERLLHLPA